MKTISFIGAGNMASAIINGLLKSSFPANNICVFDKFLQKAEMFKTNGITVANNLTDACNFGEIILIAVKPQNYEEVLSDISKAINTDGKLFVSIGAGVSTKAIEKMLSRKAAVVRCMPNTPLQIGKGVTAICRNELVNDEDFAIASDIFKSSGMIIPLDESELNTIICANGSSPAYFYYFIDSMVKSVKAQGLNCDEKTLLEAICRTVIGSAEMLMASDKTPSELIAAVTSPGGTTERAMNVFYNKNVDKIIDDAMCACTVRAEEMAKAIEDK